MAELVEKSLLSSLPNIKVDRRTDWLVYLLETISLMKKNEKCLVQILSVPLHFDWGVGVKEGYEGFKKGEIRHKFRFNKKEVGNLAVKGVAGVILGAHSTMVELFGSLQKSMIYSHLKEP